MIFIQEQMDREGRKMHFRKYFEIFKYSVKTQIKFILDYCVSLCSFAIHVFVFNELWDYILQGKQVVGYTREELIWYIIIAEFITYSSFKAYKKISEMVKNGTIANMLIRPVDFVNYTIMENMSVYIKAFVNLICAIVIGLVLVGPIPISGIGLVFAFVAAMIGVFIGILLQVFIGLISFFTEENNSFWLIVQKLSFFLVFTPIEFYPEIVQKILACLPTTYLVYAPARIFTKFDLVDSLQLLGLEVLSGVVLYVVIRLMYRKGVKKINVNGG